VSASTSSRDVGRQSSIQFDTTVDDFDVELPEEPGADLDDGVPLGATPEPPDTTVADFDVEFGVLLNDEERSPDDPVDVEALTMWVTEPVPGICLATTNPNTAAVPAATMATDLEVQRTLAIAKRRCSTRERSWCCRGGLGPPVCPCGQVIVSFPSAVASAQPSRHVQHVTMRTSGTSYIHLRPCCESSCFAFV